MSRQEGGLLGLGVGLPAQHRNRGYRPCIVRGLCFYSTISYAPLHPKKQNAYLIRPRFFVFLETKQLFVARSLVPLLCVTIVVNVDGEENGCPQVPSVVYFRCTVRDVSALGSGAPAENELESLFRVKIWSMGCHIDSVCLYASFFFFLSVLWKKYRLCTLASTKEEV